MFRTIGMPFCLLLGTLFVSVTRSSDAHAGERPNILLIVVDDLNHWVGHLGRNVQAKTPNIDRLARRGVAFSNAHCAAPVCNPSRAAMFSGKRPSTSGVYDNGIPYVNGVSVSESLFFQLKQNGYKTYASGKIWHNGVGAKDQWTKVAQQTDEPDFSKVLHDRSIEGIKFGTIDGDDHLMVDAGTTNFGTEILKQEHDSPFVLALGFHKPHMPWYVPKKYFDLHPLESIGLPPVKENDLDDVPEAGKKMALSLGDHDAVLKSGRWKEAIQAYLAAISYLDAQIGLVLDALDSSPNAKDTMIVFLGDHGWHLGEKHHWRKFTLWEESTRAPLIWVAPGITASDSRCDRPVSFMTIYPTVFDLVNVKLPSHVEGKSIRSLLEKPDADWNETAVTTFGQNNHSVRSQRYRLIQYADGGEELYDHDKDPYEWDNLAESESHHATKLELRKQLPAINVPPAPKNK